MIIEAKYIKNDNLYDLSNLFNKAYDSDNDAFFNVINRSLFFKTLRNKYEMAGIYTSYKVVANDTWTLISYKTYKTVELWWIICKFNNIQNPFIQPTTGDVLKVLDIELVDSILQSLRS